LKKSLAVLLCLALAVAFLPVSQLFAAQAAIYDDQLAPGWANWSWGDNINLQSTAVVHSGSYSISVTYTGGWQGLQLYYPGFSTAGYDHLTFWMHGGSTGGQRVRVYMTYPNGQSGPDYNIPAPSANHWSRVDVPLSALNAAGTTIARLVWQEATGHAQPTFYLDDIAFTSDEHPDGPLLTEGDLLPRAALHWGTVTGRVRVSDPQGLADIAQVSLDGAALGQGEVLLQDDGRSNDGPAGNGVFGAAFANQSASSPAEHILTASARDQAGHTNHTSLGAFVALASPGGAIPAALPQRPGLGTNEWSSTPGQDWQVNSGVPWDYVYQYITEGWENWGPTFVNKFVTQAWNKNYIPVISVYLVLGITDCTEDAVCYAQRLQNGTVVNTYVASLQQAAQQASGAKPVIFHLEPDFYGFMQQLSNQPARRPPGVRQDDPTSYPVALNRSGYPNNLAGFGRYIVDLIHATAPNALVAPHASMWATNQTPQIVLPAEVVNLAQRTASFINAMGGAQSDLYFVEWDDRDSGWDGDWWDDTNRGLPRPTRAVLWENALSQAAGKRLILWQMPCGNMSLDNTCNRYQDNRAAYVFSHLPDLFDAGVIAVLFGGGAECMTRPSTDGGHIRDQAALAYANPATPGGLTAGAPIGPSVPLYWNENSEPDLAGYRLSYEPASGGTPAFVEVGRANAARLLIPQAGDWRIRLAARDAMGNLSNFSAAITVTTTESAQQVFLPFAQK